MEFSNRKFYEGKLVAHESVKNWNLAFSPQVLEFVDTAGCGFEEKEGEDSGSRCNPEELQLLRKHYDAMMENGDSSISIGVISPYRAQVDLLRAEFADHHQVSVNTVDSFQGQERDVIYISMVRSNDKGEIGFLKDYRRMNVAMTRARKKLIIIGDSATLGNDKFYGDLLSYAESCNSYRTAWEFMY